jgi:hypothetical protein
MNVNVTSDKILGDGLSGHEDETVYHTDEAANRIIMKMKSSERGSVVTKEILA